jgi:RND family efflux transporter MFP subunit
VIAAGVPIITISTRKDLRIEAEISSEDAGKIKSGMPVSVTSAAYPGQVFPASITSVLPVGELKPDAAIRTRIIRARIALARDWQLFRSGMELDVEGTAILKKALCVPSDAINLVENRALVYVVEGDVVRARRVEIGYAHAAVTEFNSGLKPGERVVVSGKEGLSDNARVKVRP